MIRNLFILVLAALGGGCLPRQARWEQMPVSVCATSAAEIAVVEYINSEIKSEALKIQETNCDIDIETVDSLPGEYLGFTTYSFKEDDNSILDHAHIKIRKDVLDSMNNPYTDAAIAHELGHALGHIYHSESGLMKAQVQPLQLSTLMRDDFLDWFHSVY